MINMMKIVIIVLITTLTSLSFDGMMAFRVRDTNRERCPRVIMLIQFELYSQPPSIYLLTNYYFYFGYYINLASTINHQFQPILIAGESNEKFSFIRDDGLLVCGTILCIIRGSTGICLHAELLLHVR